MVEGLRLLEVDTKAPRTHFDGRDRSLVVELLDRPHGAVGDVQSAVTLPKLDAIAHREAALLDALDLECPAVLRVDGAGEAALLQLEPEDVLPLVDRDHPGTLAGLDALATAHEAQCVADAIARRAALLLLRQVLPHHHRRLDALPLHAAGFDERLPNAAIQVLALGVARRDHDPATAVRDEIPRDRLVPQARVRDLHHTAGLLEELHSAAHPPRLGGHPHNLAERLVPLPANHVQTLGRDPRAVDEQREGRARFHRAVLLPVAHQRDLGPHPLGPV